MKVTIEIEEDSKLIEALAAEITKTKTLELFSGTPGEKEGPQAFELARPASALTCVAFSCGIS